MSARAGNKYELDTPCLVLDEAVFMNNMESVHDAAKAAGKNVRPHAKTHKCSIVARKQIEAGAVGLCAAKISEAEVLSDTGLANILITGPLATRMKVERYAALLVKAPTLMLVVDNLASARLLDETLCRKKLSAAVFIDLDVGLGRTGVSLDKSMAFARDLQRFPSLTIRGIQAYAGQAQHIASYEDRKETSLECMRNAAGVFSALRQECPTCEIFSGAGTGTYEIDSTIPELTELQVGSYVLMDVEYMDVGLSSGQCLGDRLKPALTLLTTVVSVNQEGFVTVDAGLKTLYRHGGTPRVLSKDHGSLLTYDWFGDEYGKITFPAGFEAPEVGAVLELAVSHCDPTVNLFDEYHISRDDKVVDVWPIDLRGKSQ